MAEAAFVAILTGFVANVAAQPLQNIRLPLWFQDELRKLKDTVTLIKEVILDAEKEQDSNDQVQVWLDSLEDVILDVDNLENKVFYKKLEDEVVPGKIKAKVRNLNPRFRWQISSKITQIRATLADIKENKDFILRLERLGVAGVPASTMGGTESDSYQSSDQVIGRSTDKQNVLGHLLEKNIEGEENVSVVSIVGLGGLGKTTLAKFVFNDETVKGHFENKTYWVFVSNVFDLKLLLQKIIRSVTGTSPEPNLEREQLQEQLRKEIQGKKYLLVLDNVWNEDIGQWDSLKTILNVGGEGSKVLITTRSEIVAQMTTHLTRICRLGHLDEITSRVLFEREAFSQQSYEPTVYPRLVEIGRDIVAKCQGVPLAIKAIATLLKSKQYTSRDLESEWKSFRDTKLAEVDFGDQSENMMAILKLSYNNLQPDLKHCFSYCSLFPKDHEINVGQLIKLWIAQGFIIPNRNTQLEEIGYKNFMILLRRYFFQEYETDELPSRSIRYCKMHHFMHDLACLVAGKSTNILDENLVDQYTRSIRLGRNATNAFKKVRHIYVEFKSDDSCRISTMFNEKKVRTFIIPQSKNLSSSHYDDILSKFKYLRALSLRIERDVVTLPNKFGRLKYLRYLDLSHNRYIMELPHSITELYYLQTLILCFCSSLVSLPTDIQNLISLRHLEIDGCLRLTHMPRGIGRLALLQTLDMFVVAENNLNERGGFGELSRLKNLHGRLTIQILGLGESGEFLNDKEHLESLKLNWEIRERVENAKAEAALRSLEPHKDIKAIQVWNYPGETFPKNWFSLLTSLVRLEISCCTKLKYLPPLHQLSSLQELKLEFLSALEYVSDRDHLSSSTISFFPSLRTLKIMECPKLHGWWGRGGQTLTGHQPQQQQQQQQLPFPVLSELEISNCSVLNSVTLFPNLETLKLDGTSFKPLALKIMSVAASSSSSYSFNLSKLKVLTVHNLEHLEPQLLDALTNSLPSLQSSRIRLSPA